jgi:ubiquinone/menaquinone biosynthesis C-methylase UbiE
MSLSASTRGTNYGEHGIENYAKFAHATDMALFLDPFLKHEVDQQSGKRMLDAGCGAAPWSIYAASQGAFVDAIDLQPGMIEKARDAIKTAGFSDYIKASVGDATALSFEPNTFDYTISVNVGCNLPSSIFNQHFTEIARTLKPDGYASIAAPDSLDTLFTDALCEEDEVRKTVHATLFSLPNNPERDMIVKTLEGLEHIVSATFAIRNGRLALVEDASSLQSGQLIYRKLTHVTIPNHYHSEEEYLRSFSQANLKVTAVSRRVFASSEARQICNNAIDAYPTLGRAYERRSPFVVYHVTKNSL